MSVGLRGVRLHDVCKLHHPIGCMSRGRVLARLEERQALIDLAEAQLESYQSHLDRVKTQFPEEAQDDPNLVQAFRK